MCRSKGFWRMSVRDKAVESGEKGGSIGLQDLERVLRWGRASTSTVGVRNGFERRQLVEAFPPGPSGWGSNAVCPTCLPGEERRPASVAKAAWTIITAPIMA